MEVAKLIIILGLKNETSGQMPNLTACQDIGVISRFDR